MSIRCRHCDKPFVNGGCFNKDCRQGLVKRIEALEAGIESAANRVPPNASERYWDGWRDCIKALTREAE